VVGPRSEHGERRRTEVGRLREKKVLQGQCREEWDRKGNRSKPDKCSVRL